MRYILHAVGSLFLLTLTVCAAEAPGPSPFHHPVLDIWRQNSKPDSRELESWRVKAKELLDLSDAQVRAIIPRQTPQIHLPYCPACNHKHPAPEVLPEQPKAFPGRFNPTKPDEVSCQQCGTVFPNAEFPMNQTEVFRNLLGEDITVPFFDDKTGPRTLPEKFAGKSHHLYFEGIVDTARKLWLLPRMKAAASVYNATADERYAKRLILILDELAMRYPHWLLTSDYGHHYVTTKNRAEPYGWIDTRWGRRSFDDLPEDLLTLFDAVAGSPALDATTRENIRTNLFLGPLKRQESWGTEEDPNLFFGNECPIADHAARALILEDPELVHQCYKNLLNIPRYSTACDGIFRESLGYGSLFRLTLFKGARMLDGYSDPAGFVGKDGKHLQNINPTVEMEDFFRRLCKGPDLLRLPSGGWLSYSDSGPGFGPTWWSAYGESCRPLDQSRPVMLPGLRRAILGAGSGDHQVQVALDFAEHGVNHGKQSGLSMQIFAFGHHLIDDFPYHKSTLRRYSEMTISHPTVVIDHKNQEAEQTDGDVSFYAPLMDGMSAIRVENARAYSGLASKYARTLILNSADADLPYVIDIFEVAGGTLHDYHLRSSSQHPSDASTSIALQPLQGLRPLLPAGEKWVEPQAARKPVGSGYGLLFDAKRADITAPFSFTNVCREPWKIVSDEEKVDLDQHPKTVGAWLAGSDSWKDRPEIGIRHHVAVGQGYEFIAAQSPSLTESGFYGSKGKPAEQWPRIPHHVLRHPVKKGESSVFVVVHEPYHHSPKISAVKRLETGDDNLIALRVETPDRVDTLLYALDSSRKASAGGLNMNGRLSLVSRRQGQSPRAYLIEGTHLQADGVELRNPVAKYTGSVTTMERRWSNSRLRVNCRLPAGDALRGTWMMVNLGPWEKIVTNRNSGAKTTKHFSAATQVVEIDHIESDDLGSWVYTADDLGLSQDSTGVDEFYWPRRHFAGTAQVSIPNVATTHPRSPSPRQIPPAIHPEASEPAGLKPGLHFSLFSGTGNDLTSLNRESRSIVDATGAANIKVNTRQRAAQLEGYLRVPDSGIYTFHFGGMDEYRMRIGGTQLIESFRGCTPMPEAQQVHLQAGLYRVSLECFVNKGILPPWLTADWQKEGMARRSFLPEIFCAP